jgi:hypothetical protein
VPLGLKVAGIGSRINRFGYLCCWKLHGSLLNVSRGTIRHWQWSFLSQCGTFVEHAILLGFPTSVSRKRDITHLMGSCFYEHVFVFHAKISQRLIVRGSPFLGHI